MAKIDRLVALKTLLQTAPYTALATPDEKLAEVNAKDKSFNLPITARPLLKWAAQGRASKLARAAADDASSHSKQSLAIVAVKLLDKMDVEIDMDDAQMVALMNALVSEGILVQADVDALVALGAYTGSDAEKHGIVEKGGEVYLGHINQALALING